VPLARNRTRSPSCSPKGWDGFRHRVKLSATDADEEALTQARQATYSAKTVADLAPDLLSQYFERVRTPYVFRSDLRRAIIFGRHDLMQDAPMPRLDLIVCRNTLRYFNAEVQSRVLARFHFALNDHGFLFLGKAEMLLTHQSLYPHGPEASRLHQSGHAYAP
jgi:two-component system CheB/CheR fusion protein